MIGIILPQKELMLNSATDIDKVCAPLRRHGVKFCSFVRIFPDGSRINLNNDIEAAKYTHYDSNAYQGYQAETSSKKLGTGIYLGQSINDSTLTLLRTNFDIDHMLIFIRELPTCIEIFNFGTYNGNSEIYSVYLNNINYFQKFQYYFKDQCRDLIKLYENNRLDSPKIDNNTLELLGVEKLNPKDIKIRRYYVDGSYIYLTKREVECLEWLAAGKTSQQIASLLKVNSRTVEKHIESTKSKLNCSKATQLIYKAVKLGIIY